MILTTIMCWTYLGQVKDRGDSFKKKNGRVIEKVIFRSKWLSALLVLKGYVCGRLIY